MPPLDQELALPSSLLRQASSDPDLEAQIHPTNNSVELAMLGHSKDGQVSSRIRSVCSDAVSSHATCIEIRTAPRTEDGMAKNGNTLVISEEYLSVRDIQVEDRHQSWNQKDSNEDVAVTEVHSDSKREFNAEHVNERGPPVQLAQGPKTFLKEGAQEVWSECAKQVWEHQREMIDRWKDELNIMLIFAGLFSAILTAFVIEYYPTLQPPTSDTTTQLLAMMAMQLNLLTGSGHDSPLESVSSLISSSSATKVSSQIVAINGLWFAALVFSLGAASLAISVNQWLNHHRTRPLTMSRESVEIWYLRHQSLDRWKVPLIINLLPVLLQASMALFLIGLVVFLGPMSTSVSAIACGLVSLFLLVTIGTAIIPAIVSDCAYKSPQAWWSLKLLCGPQRLVCSVVLKLLYHYSRLTLVLSARWWKVSLEQRKAAFRTWKLSIRQWKTSLRRLRSSIELRNIVLQALLDGTVWRWADILRQWEIALQQLWHSEDWRACELDSLDSIRWNANSSAPFLGEMLAEAYTTVSDSAFIVPVSLLCLDTTNYKTVLHSLSTISMRGRLKDPIGRVWGQYYATRANEQEKYYIIATLDSLIDVLPMISDNSRRGMEDQWRIQNNIRGLMQSMNDWSTSRLRLRKMWQDITVNSGSGPKPVLWKCTVKLSYDFENELDLEDLAFFLSAALHLGKGDIDMDELFLFSRWCLNLARVRKWCGSQPIHDELQSLVMTTSNFLKASILAPQRWSTRKLTASETVYLSNFMVECTKHAEEESGVVTASMLAFLIELACSCELYKSWESTMQKEVRKMRELVCFPKGTLDDIDDWFSRPSDQQPARREGVLARLRARIRSADLPFHEKDEALSP
ncbi:uncharacterized protein FIBRA_00819 [Fibroporia radiculosa]|uniref:DUF6535 domain-containing protein n=1 Tax=Fibroporia radiculosa TaxID=599839 RepID=J4H0R6_9APHY|nr:uncharacterized protein FIBRA_00819 [Fibroporia radiculosa]CCL98814.1 predicted protein [Fibroporia radiculosa]